MNELIKGAIARFAAKHGRKLWKTELRKCWSRSSYPGMGSDDSSYLQMARNSGVDLDKLTYDELTSPTPITTLVFQGNEEHGLLDVSNSDCELRVHIYKSEDGYYLEAEAVDVTTEEAQSDFWYAFNEFTRLEEAFETIGAAVAPDCAWFTGGRWVWSELPDAINCAKLFADALGVSEARKSSTNQTATLTIEFTGDLADSLRAIANLVEEYGPAFLSDPTAFYGIHNDGTVHRVDVSIKEPAPIDPSQVW